VYSVLGTDDATTATVHIILGKFSKILVKVYCTNGGQLPRRSFNDNYVEPKITPLYRTVGTICISILWHHRFYVTVNNLFYGRYAM